MLDNKTAYSKQYGQSEIKFEINSIPIWIMHIHLAGTMNIINASDSSFSSSQSKSLVDVDCMPHTKKEISILMEIFPTNEIDLVLHIVSFFPLYGRIVCHNKNY